MMEGSSLENHKIDVEKNFKKYEKIADKLKAIAHPYRLCIVKGLIDGECNVTTIQECLNLPQSTVSQHISKLKSAGIIEGTRNGLEICYRVVDNDIINIVKLLLND
ncbi:ArsR/SmtB family transcription factor [Thermoanaerobacterium thermosaccharolyticum]|jgi:predicted transcriptional regulator|uniref:ArsR family transcriptional regulator n=2 Tax=Thermoanaerobacterium thermosaccharolyticum TaxID=1517 RepID=A0A223HZD9_THETR|nr:metalloregulator ArsR/SmtB family transcription factor [Thermoanaerobacterium thermosaccharolyticum]AST57674.1 ArsR family transcriptional regulator [Thermoanaerobacterium thermosaccharolyticum]